MKRLLALGAIQVNQSVSRDLDRLLGLWAEIDDLRQVAAILDWDEKTQMPDSGAPARADQKATLERLIHQKMTDPELGRLLDALSCWELEQPLGSDQASMVRVARREHTRATKVPESLVMEMSRAGSTGYVEWLKAREAKDFRLFAPALARVFEVSVKLAEALGYKEHPLDAMIDLSEPGMTTREVEGVFDELRQGLVPLVEKIAPSGGSGLRNPQRNVLNQYFDPVKQWEIGLEAVRAIGFRLEHGRADKSVHPFSTSFYPNDVRITTRVFPDEFGSCFFSFLHEAGHGHYMQGIPLKYARTPLNDGASAGMHESQSRTWENIVGRSIGFWRLFYPKVQAMFPAETKDVSLEEWYRAVNRVERTFIRTEADEVTYNLHIMIRFELEKAVWDGHLAIPDLRDAWNDKFQEYLGIVPPDDRVGVLQDIHWSGSFGGAFVGYTLGNVMSVQLYEACMRDRPDVGAGFQRGDYSSLLDWSRDNVHAHGAKYEPAELIEVATGEPLSPKPYLRYIARKFSEIYGLGE